MSRMPPAQYFIDLAEQGKVPDTLIRCVIRQLCKRRLVNETAGDSELQQARFQALIKQLAESPIALETDAANEQHYEVPTPFYLNSFFCENLQYNLHSYLLSTATVDNIPPHSA